MKVTITPEALTHISGLPKGMIARVESVLERLESWPQVSGVKWLTGDWAGFARIRTGNYRVIFRLKDRNTIVVERIADRRDAYAE